MDFRPDFFQRQRNTKPPLYKFLKMRVIKWKAGCDAELAKASRTSWGKAFTWVEDLRTSARPLLMGIERKGLNNLRFFKTVSSKEADLVLWRKSWLGAALPEVIRKMFRNRCTHRRVETGQITEFSKFLCFPIRDWGCGGHRNHRLNKVKNDLRSCSTCSLKRFQSKDRIWMNKIQFKFLFKFLVYS